MIKAEENALLTLLIFNVTANLSQLFPARGLQSKTCNGLGNYNKILNFKL